MIKKFDPIFILSCERSGSTMLRYIIDTHPAIVCPSHLYLGNVLENLNRMVFATLSQTQVGLDEKAQRQFTISKTNEIIFGIMSDYVKAKSKQIWCEKTPMNLEYLSLLEEHFPNAKYVCLYRQCMDVVNSSINLSKYRFLPEHIPYIHRNPGNIVAAIVENWLEKTERLLAFESAHTDRCYRIEYESIVMSPDQTLESLFGFLNVEWDEGLVERVFRSDHDVGEGDGKAVLSHEIRKNSVGKGIEVPRSGIPSKFLERIDECLYKLSYSSLDDFYLNLNKTTDDEFKLDSSCDSFYGVFEKRFKNAITKNRKSYPMLYGVWKIVIDGRLDKAWFIDLSTKNTVVTQNILVEDFVINLPGVLLSDMMDGRRDAVEAFLQGEIQLVGSCDRSILSDFGRLIFS